MMTLLKDWQECVGKTVAMVSRAEYIDDDRHVAIVFTDGCVLLIGYEKGWEGDVSIVLEERDDLDNEDLKNLGLLSKEEYERLFAEQKAKDAASRLAAERRQYEELKRKFEGK